MTPQYTPLRMRRSKPDLDIVSLTQALPEGHDPLLVRTNKVWWRVWGQVVEIVRV